MKYESLKNLRKRLEKIETKNKIKIKEVQAFRDDGVLLEIEKHGNTFELNLPEDILYDNLKVGEEIQRAEIRWLNVCATHFMKSRGLTRSESEKLNKDINAILKDLSNEIENNLRAFDTSTPKDEKPQDEKNQEYESIDEKQCVDIDYIVDTLEYDFGLDVKDVIEKEDFSVVTVTDKKIVAGLVFTKKEIHGITEEKLKEQLRFKGINVE